jgi:hypothetical protein
VFSGEKSHEQRAGNASIQHYFLAAKPIELSSAEDELYAYVYIDPKAQAKELILQFNDGSWEHRGAWGSEALIPQGVDGSESRRRIGPMPKAGKWVKLEVKARQIGFTKGSKINGISFDQFGGHVYWDKVGVVKKDIAEQPALGDVMWTLFTSPEFQYIK